jgi:hypothetical protein
MSGDNIPILTIPPGVWRNGTQYAAGKRWYDANWVRWLDNQLTPIGGWNKTSRVYGTSADVIRDAFSWRDNNKKPWRVVGSEEHAFTTYERLDSVEPTPPVYDITPADLDFTPPPPRGYGRDAYGSYTYGRDLPATVDAVGQWSFDNYGRQLVAVHSQDGRLFMWDPTTPTTKAAVVANAPINNTLVIVTDERMVMVLGGKGNPRRVKWCSRENLTDWTPTAENTAGGFEIESSGTIVSAVKVQGGVLVLTDSDVHIIEYIGAPNYYSRRRISDETSCFSKNALISVTGGAFWLSEEGFWRYDGVVSPVPSPVDTEVLKNGNLSRQHNVFLGYNGHNREVWCFYPKLGVTGDANRYVFLSLYAEPYWSMGRLRRTAWLNPIWETNPYMYVGNVEYRHEDGVYADEVSRIGSVWATTGEFEIGEGDQVMRVDRIYPDSLITEDGEEDVNIVPPGYSLTFKLRQAPLAKRRTVPTVNMDTIPKGYKGTRFRARAISMRVDQTKDAIWIMGKLRLRMKESGAR